MWKYGHVAYKSIYRGAFLVIILLARFAASKYNSNKVLRFI